MFICNLGDVCSDQISNFRLDDCSNSAEFQCQLIMIPFIPEIIWIKRATGEARQSNFTHNIVCVIAACIAKLESIPKGQQYRLY